MPARSVHLLMMASASQAWAVNMLQSMYQVYAVCVQVRENLELSFVQEAEMVFTTLSSTGRKIFSRLENAFENVLVDEAAQASEIAVLQPLTLGCTR